MMNEELTNKEAIEWIEGLRDRWDDTTNVIACNMAIQALKMKQETIERYKPIILQEHDAEPRRLKSILDVKTNDIYILKTTKGFVEYMGITIEDRNVDGEGEDEE